MLKRILKGCLAVALVCTMAAPVMAEEGSSSSFWGRARGKFQQKTVKDGASTMDMAFDGRFGASLKTEAGAWTSHGDIGFNISEGGVASLHHGYAALENETMYFQLGYDDPTGICPGHSYAPGNVLWMGCVGDYVGKVKNPVSGEEIYKVGTQSKFLVKMKDLGLKAWLGMNAVNTGKDDTTADGKKLTEIGLFYSKAMGAISIDATYISVGSAIDKKYYGTEKGKYDGGSFTTLGLGVGYAVSDTLKANFAYGTKAIQQGGKDANTNKTPDPITISTIVLAAEMGLDEVSGVSLIYRTDATALKSGTKDYTIAGTSLGLAYATKIASMKVGASYKSETSKCSDLKIDTGETNITLGMQYAF